MNQYFEVSYQDNVAIVYLDQKDSPINKISPDMILECERVFADFGTRTDLEGIVLISRKKDFVAGADLDAIYAVKEPHKWEPIARKGHDLLRQIEQSKYPVVAAIHGAAMGGGLEIALACHYRIVSDHASTVLSLPEVQLGLLPGGGGTQRLPALIGIRNALDMMLTAKKIYANKAVSMGLADRAVSEHALLREAIQQVKDMTGKKWTRQKHQTLQDRLLEGNPIGRKIIFDKARQKVESMTSGNYPAPLKIIECVEAGVKYGSEIGYETEVQKFDELVVSPVSKRLTDLFFGMNEKKKNPNASIARPANKVVVLGSGFMGAGIAEVNIGKSIPTILKDIKPELIAKAKGDIWQSLQKRVQRKALSSWQAQQTMGYLNGQTHYENIENADMIIEAVFEDLKLKQRVLAECEAATGEQCIFATNTSALPVSEIAQHAQRPHLVVGMHYFSPVPKMPLLEIVVTPKTADWVAASAVELGIKQGKTCIVVKDKPGFYTTRILAPLLNEALLMMEEGADLLLIDQYAREAGFPVGPVTLMDEVGIDVGAHIMTGKLIDFFRERGADAVKMSLLIGKMSAAGFAGRKNRKGFYLYDDKGKKLKNKINPAVYTNFLANSPRQTLSHKEVRLRLLLMMVNEAARCLEEGIIQSPLDGDLGAVLGLGFPPFTGGPFRYLDGVSCTKTVAHLENLAAKHGARFTPADILTQYAQQNRRFY